jgi:hypothetical protein
MTRISICALLALAVIAGGTLAQCSGYHGGVSLTLNGTDPGTLAGNLLTVSSPYSLALEVADANGANFPLILIGGTAILCGALPATPTLSIDVAGAAVIVDGTGTGLGTPALSGLGNTPLNFSIGFPTVIWQGLNGPALQAIILDPSAGTPVPFISTSAGQPYFSNATTTTYILPDDGGVSHALGGAGISWGGVMQTTVYLNSNGQITFSAVTGDFTQTLAEHFSGFAGAGAGVSVMYCDLNRIGLGSDTSITENLLTGDVTVNYNNQNWWATPEPAGSFSANFTGPLLTLDYSNLVTQVTGTSNFIIGVTDGNAGVGTDTDLSVLNGGLGILNSLGAYVSPGIDDSIAEEFVAGDATALAAQGTINFLDVLNYSWTIF